MPCPILSDIGNYHVITSLVRHYYIIITSLLRHYYTFIITSLLCHYYVIITSLLRHYYIIITSSLLHINTSLILHYYIIITSTHVTQDSTSHPGFLALQFRLTCDQICTGAESLHVKYGAKEKKRNGNNWEP